MNSKLSRLFNEPQFSLDERVKSRILLEEFNYLVRLHKEKCPEYLRVIRGLNLHPPYNDLEAVPFLPISLFKKHELKSIGANEIFKVLVSSGTTNSNLSKIYIDEETAQLQRLALSRILRTVLGEKRLPLLIIDSENTVRNYKEFNARSAGIRGMMPFSNSQIFCLNPDMSLNTDVLRGFLSEYGQKKFMIFGFTFMVWQHFYKEAQNLGLSLNLEKGVLLHSGGWKKLIDESVSNREFRLELNRMFNLTKIHNFYGMVEQTGSIFLEDDSGYFCASNFSDVIVRDPNTWSPTLPGQVGVLEVMSVLPRSYPGHAILTEDLARELPEAENVSGWKGRKFEILGRVPRAELRGCSDVHAEKFSNPTLEITEIS
ncbi:MAG: acyl-protein synthetase [Deltaproteobacteria bacterium]